MSKTIIVDYTYKVFPDIVCQKKEKLEEVGKVKIKKTKIIICEDDEGLHPMIYEEDE